MNLMHRNASSHFALFSTCGFQVPSRIGPDFFFAPIVPILDLCLQNHVRKQLCLGQSKRLGYLAGGV